MSVLAIWLFPVVVAFSQGKASGYPLNPLAWPMAWLNFEFPLSPRPVFFWLSSGVGAITGYKISLNND
jgi:hypothetical protein